VSRRFAARRPIRLSDTNAEGRLRLDAVARYLQDVASDDVADAGFRAEDHVWVVRRTELEVAAPFAKDEHVTLETWCSGVAGASAARRTSVAGDRGGRIEAESIWIHLDHDLAPKRLDERFLAVYGASAEGRRPSTRFTLAPPRAEASTRGWPLRPTDEDRLGHVNNAVFWIPVEETWAPRLGVPLRVVLEYRRPIDVEEEVLLAVDGAALWLLVGDDIRAAAILQSA
jgi:acyl-ACP thioesterase